MASGQCEIDDVLYAKRPLMSGRDVAGLLRFAIAADVLRDAPPDIGPEELTELALGLAVSLWHRLSGSNARTGIDAAVRHWARCIAVDQELIAPAADLAERPPSGAELRNILRDFDYVEQIARNQPSSPASSARQGTRPNLRTCWGVAV